MAAVFASAMGTGVFSFTLPLMNLDEKASGLWLGSSFAGYFLAKLLIAPFSGIIADHTGAKKPLLISCLLAALLPALYFLDPSIETLYTIQFVLGLCAGSIRTLSMTAISSAIENEKLTSKFAHLSAVMNSSFLLGPLLGGLLYINKDLIPVLIAMSVFMGSSFLLFFVCPPYNKIESKHTKDAPHEAASLKAYSNIMIAVFGRGLGIGCIIAFYPVLIKSVLQFSPGMTALIFSIPNLTTVLLLPLAGKIAAGHNRRLVTCCGMLISTLALYLLASSNGITNFALAGILSGVGTSISMPASMSICAELGSEKGRTIGLANMASNLGFMFGPLFCGLLVTTTGHISSPFKLIAVAGAISTLPLLHEGLRKCGLKITAHITAIAAALILISAFPLIMQKSTPANSPKIFRHSDVAMGTVVNISIPGKEQSFVKDAAREAISIMHKLQKDLDHRNKRGSVGRLNHAAGKRSIRVSDKAYKTIKNGLEISKNSGGSFDITIGAITTTPFYYALDKSRFAKHKNLIDYKLVEISPQDNRIKLPHKGMAIDLGGLAKGTIIDAASDHLKKNGISTAMVEAGGDFMVFGDRLWSIGIRNPRGDGILGKIEVKNSAVCGSGDYYQFISPISADDKNRKHHILDPARLQSSNECIATTTIAPNAETADALATAVFIMGPAKGSDFINKHFPECSAMWILPDLSIKSTENFPPIKNTALSN